MSICSYPPTKEGSGKPPFVPKCVAKLAKTSVHEFVPITCDGCGESFNPRRSDQRCCSAGCRVRAQTARKKHNTGESVSSI